MNQDKNNTKEFITTLEKEHRKIDKNISKLLKHNYSDSLKIQTLKRKKLALKDQINRLSKEITTEQLT